MIDEPGVQKEVSYPTGECPEPQLWHCYDGMATEVEVLKFLKALVEVSKPKVIVETGTYLGYGTCYLAQGVKENGFGHVYTAEVNIDFAEAAKRRLIDADLYGYVVQIVENGQNMISGMHGPIDFAFLDSDLYTRLPELEVLYPKLSQSALVVVHDTGRQHDGPGTGPRSQMAWFAKQHQMQILNLDTPRGVVIMRRQVL